MSENQLNVSLFLFCHRDLCDNINLDNVTDIMYVVCCCFSIIDLFIFVI